MKTWLPAREHIPALLGSLPALALFVGWAADDGGYEPTTWYAGALALLFLLAAVIGALGTRIASLHPAALAALGGLAAYTLWSYASILWADVPGEALEGANRTLLYLLVALVFASLPWTVAALRLALLGFVLALAGLAVLTVIRVAGAEDPLPLFANARLTAPLGYQNASPAMWTMAALPALVLASLRDTPVAIRALLLGSATVFVELAMVSQSRTWLVTLPLLGLLALALSPVRLRLMIAAAPVAVAAFVASPDLLEVYNRGGGGPDDFRPEEEVAKLIVASFDDASRAILVSGLAVTLVGAIWALTDRRIAVPERVRGGLAKAGVVVALVAAAGSVFAAATLAPRFADAWEEFSSGADPTEAGGTRFSSLGSSRADFWRASWEIARDNPIVGIGQDNFSHAYLVRAESSEQPRWTHSLQLRLLVHTGFAGLALFVVFIGGALAAAWAARRSLAPPQRVVLAAAILPFATWVVAGSVDWFWEMPALSAPAIAFLISATALAPRRSRKLPYARLGLAGAAALGLAAFVVLAGPWLAARHTAIGLAALPDVPAALRHLDSAERLNPLAFRAPLTKGFIAVRQRRYDDAREAFQTTLDRNPFSWLAELELGALASIRGDKALARRHVARAAALIPRDRIVQEALQQVTRRKKIDIHDLNDDLTAAERQVTAR